MDKQEYLETKVKPIIENLIFQLICERPENPVDFMVNWLQKTGGFNPNGLTEIEVEELNLLREEVKKYQEKEEKMKNKKK
jgi:hypothetical protein